jgi:hypothetical protein
MGSLAVVEGNVWTGCVMEVTDYPFGLGKSSMVPHQGFMWTKWPLFFCTGEFSAPK